MKKNCWEFKKCGRGAGGRDSDRLGVCPAATDERLHTVHGGTKAGRACWLVAGTLCGGAVQGTFAQKYGACQRCDFFRMVKKEEGSNYIYSISIISWIKAFRREDDMNV